MKLSKQWSCSLEKLAESFADKFPKVLNSWATILVVTLGVIVTVVGKEVFGFDMTQFWFDVWFWWTFGVGGVLAVLTLIVVLFVPFDDDCNTPDELELNPDD